ncbi:hypothetical protein GJU43_21935 [Flavobacterium sp. LC2016-23]|uniref:hypothetical protein n=1 Tax=Flavobacterium sp. LC2016-23 TaxID=2666330 RepID=UPI0012B0D36D|nr:hypothetical protein [Flavobacterium sp. LC2016-23]MRX41947.1 hypothetical protein [Flavobacterium sp. LC2016-23]
MKLERLDLEKFKDCTLKKEQLFALSGGGTKTGPDNICGEHGPEGKIMNFDYGYDVYRNGTLTFHNRSNVKDLCLQSGRE